MRAMQQRVRLRTATAADVSVLCHWDSKPHVAEATGGDEPYDWKSELPRAVEWRAFLIAEVAGDPIGFIQIIDPAVEETHYWGQSSRICAPSISGSAKRRISGGATARR